MQKNTSATLEQEPGSLLPKRKDRFMIKVGHSSWNRHKT